MTRPQVHDLSSTPMPLPPIRLRPALAGLVAGAAAAVVAVAVAGYFASDCGNPGAMFACLLEGIVIGVAGPVLAVVAAWLVLRALRARRPLLTALLAAGLSVALAVPALQLVEGLRALAGQAPEDPGTTAAWGDALAAALTVGTAAALAVHLMSGRVTWRWWAATAAAVVLALGASAAAQVVQEDRRLRADLAGASVPLTAPPAGWDLGHVYVADDGSTHADVHPAGGQPYGDDALDVTVSPTPTDPDCTYQRCRTVDGVLVAASENITSAYGRVDGAHAEVRAYTTGSRTEQLLVDVARGLRVVDVDEVASLVD